MIKVELKTYILPVKIDGNTLTNVFCIIKCIMWDLFIPSICVIWMWVLLEH